MRELTYAERPALGGALPRAPLTLPGLDGYHWFGVREVGYPEPASFADGYSALCRFHDELWRRSRIPPQRAVLGGGHEIEELAIGQAIAWRAGVL